MIVNFERSLFREKESEKEKKSKLNHILLSNQRRTTSSDACKYALKKNQQLQAADNRSSLALSQLIRTRVY